MDFNFISLVVMIFFYLFAGISHFKNPKFFIQITPKWVYKPDLVNIIIGILEIGLALGLVLETTRSISAIGIIILLILVFPANVYHLQISIKKKRNIIGTIIRLPVQGLLIYWAYIFI